MDKTAKELQKLRGLIDEVDEKLQKLLVHRASLVSAVGVLKTKSCSHPTFYRPDREASILRSVIHRNCGKFSKEAMAGIFRGILSACLALERQLGVGYLGPQGSFSESALIKQFGPSAKGVPYDTIVAIFEAIASEECDVGIVPYMNTTGGPVLPSIQALVESSLMICGEVYLPIHQCFMSHPQSTCMPERIYSHDQSFKQCQAWIKKHYPSVSLITVSSNALGAKIVSLDKAAAAIAGELAAKKYHLKIHHANIEDKADNTTRFFVLGNTAVPPTGKDKTTIGIKNGKLAEIERLPHLKKHLLESSKVQLGKSNSVLMIDLDIHQQATSFKKIVKELKELHTSFHIFGSYPQAPY